MSVWFYGFIGAILASTFYAGMNSNTMFYRDAKYGEVGRQINEDRVAGYMLLTIGFAITWPLTLPVIGIYMLGQKFNKGK
jgi:hypothetical protein